MFAAIFGGKGELDFEIIRYISLNVNKQTNKIWRNYIENKRKYKMFLEPKIVEI